MNTTSSNHSALRVAGLEMDLAWENPEENFRRANLAVQKAASNGAQLAVLPEMFATGFSMNAQAVAQHSEQTLTFLSDTAKRHNIWLVGGLVTPAAPRPYNTAAVFDPQGAQRAHYHKIHPFSFADEHLHYQGGTHLTQFALEGVQITLQICYDLRFPEPFRTAASNTDLFIVVANWPSARRDAWMTLLKARAIENQSYVLGVNRCGEGDGLTYSGDSMLYDPLGEPVGKKQGQQILGEISASQVRQTRQRFSFLADRKPEVYATLTPSK